MNLPFRIALPRAGLWSHADFMKLWFGQGVSMLGTMIGRPALSFVAILVLHGTPGQIATLVAMDFVPGIFVGLHAGAWVDRLPRRPILIGVDIARFFVLLWVPVAALLGALRIEQLYVVALLVSMLSVLFDVAYQAYLPSLLKKDELLEGNSKLAASSAVAEFVGFGTSGAFVALLTAPIAVLIDGVSYLLSALSLSRIRYSEATPAQRTAGGASVTSVREEIVDGLRTVVAQPVLRALALGNIGKDIANGIYGALVVLYMSRNLGFSPALLTPIWAVGGFASLLAAAFTTRITARVGVGPALILGQCFSGVGMLFVPMASGATWLSAALLIAQQFVGDLAATLFGINASTLRQAVTPAGMYGRVGASMRLGQLLALLFGTLLGGVLGNVFGVRATLVVAGGTMLLSLWLGLGASSIRGVRELPSHEDDRAPDSA